jgi:hypothetical protein
MTRMDDRTSPTGNPSLITCCLMTWFTAHHFDEPTGAANPSLTGKMNLLVKLTGLLIRREKFLVEDEGFPKWNFIRE